MKHNTFLIAAIIAVALTVVLTGCGGGSKSQDISTPWRGSIAGVDTLPPDDEIDVDVDTWIEVYWPNEYLEPPRSFTFKLYRWNDGDWDLVRTRYESDESKPDYGEWWFSPEDRLAYDTDYRIVITDNYGDSHTHYFTTEWDPTRAQSESKSAEPKKYLPKNGGTPDGTSADQHTIDTSKK